MNAVGLGLFLVLLAMLVLAPRRWAAVALLLGALYVTRGQVLEIGPANLTVPRLLVLAGFVRVLLRGERIANGMHTVDWLVLLWAAILIGTSAAHTPDAWLFRSGVVLTEVGSYFLFRVFLQDTEDLRHVFRIACLALLPVAVFMLLEKQSGENMFGALGGVNEFSPVREGQVRASGPFAHPILAGTVGAAGIAMALGIWRSDRIFALCGLLAGACIVYTCTSSGPILMVAAILFALSVWFVRDHVRVILALAAAGIVALSMLMNDPVYFLVARIDLSGGSTGYFRAQLIRSSLEHLPEWWLAGTDYTRHWMPSGIYANSYHTDITNHLLWMGVLGGLPLAFAFLALLLWAFGSAGRAMRLHASSTPQQQFLIWSLGASLFGFFATFWSISLFDQSVVFFWLIVAAIQCVAYGLSTQASESMVDTPGRGLTELTA
jgi:hypothetical protein